MTTSKITLTKREHASIILETASTRILVDPGSFGVPNDPSAFTAILLTHHHPDHAAPEFLRSALAAGVALYGPPDATSELGLSGRHWHPVDPEDSFQLGDLSIRVAGGTHAEIYPEYLGPQNRAYLVDDAVFITGDEHPLPPSAANVLITPLNAPWLRGSDLIRYIRKVRPPLVIGIHEGFLSEAGLALADQLLAALSSEGAGATRRLEVGESLAL